jgi:hypothetical protein
VRATNADTAATACTVTIMCFMLLFDLLYAVYYYRYQRALLEGGHVFIACPPLYKVCLFSTKQHDCTCVHCHALSNAC